MRQPIASVLEGGSTTTSYLISNGNNGEGANQIISETTDGVTLYYGYDADGNRDRIYTKLPPGPGRGKGDRYN